MVSIRLAIVLSVIVPFVAGVDPTRNHPIPTAVLLSAALGYALVLMFRPHWERPGSAAPLVVTSVDGALTLGLIALTGGATSPAVAILFLAVTAAATRLNLWLAIGLATVLGTGYLVVALLIDADEVPLEQRLVAGVWWPLYLLFMAVFGGSLALYAERAHAARAAANAEALAEHFAAEEERDLRARLLEAYSAQHDGLRAILHDFRTPVSSLRALSAQLGDPRGRLDQEQRATAQRLVAEHAEHLSTMLDALSDVTASKSPTQPAGQPRTVGLHELLLASSDAAGLHPPRLRLNVTPPDAVVRIDTQRIRRVLTNLIDNAARHGEGEPVEVSATVDPTEVRFDVLDRGPGLAPEQLEAVKRKDVSLGEASGGTGLGLWIVEQIVQAMRGGLDLAVRPGGGLAATVRVPLH
ncbi:HAMP domain-containing histidine kinase [Haloechinothrix sp. YIM 98757]|uniref:histidine kinase n=1 Tax=Haloechinothrix aidingensis TaxID=2752311 RepID=A0A838ABC1_9PSEU|nr:HAMP domain-containing histidine kinase [Haloechinothrix aidingensis]